jgi:hypothetical protein
MISPSTTTVSGWFVALTSRTVGRASSHHNAAKTAAAATATAPTRKRRARGSGERTKNSASARVRSQAWRARLRASAHHARTRDRSRARRSRADGCAAGAGGGGGGRDTISMGEGRRDERQAAASCRSFWRGFVFGTSRCCRELRAVPATPPGTLHRVRPARAGPSILPRRAQNREGRSNPLDEASAGE